MFKNDFHRIKYLLSHSLCFIQITIKRGKGNRKTLLEEGEEDRTGIDSRGEGRADCPYAEESDES